MEHHLPYGITQCHLPATWHSWMHFTLQAGTRFTYPVGMVDWVDLSGWLYRDLQNSSTPTYLVTRLTLNLSSLLLTFLLSVKGGDFQWALGGRTRGSEVPQQGSGARPLVRVWGWSPQKLDTFYEKGRQFSSHFCLEMFRKSLLVWS